MRNAFQLRAVKEPMEKLQFEYRNWRGETSVRTVLPVEVWYGKTKWHPETQWFLKAFDVEKGEERDFAFLDMTFNRKGV